MKLTLALLVYSCVLAVTAEEVDMHEAATGSTASVISGLVAMLHENKVTLLCTAAVVLGAYLCYPSPRATVRQRPPTREPPVALSQKGQPAALEKLATKKESFAEAAERHKREATFLKEQGQIQEAVVRYLRAASYYKAVTELVALQDPITDATLLDSRREVVMMCLAAAECYNILAEESADDDDGKMSMMQWAQVKQYEAAAEAAVAHGSRAWAGDCYSKAATLCTVLDDHVKAEQLNGAAINLFEAEADDAIANGNPTFAADCHCKAATLYVKFGNLKKAHDLRLAAAKQYQISAGENMAQDFFGLAATNYCKAAGLYQMVGEADLARKMTLAVSRITSRPH